ncbi:MAG: TorF family putative porin [Pseudomonadota bacterium]
MNKLVALTALALLPSLAVPAAAIAQESKPDYTITGNVTLASDYRFRGFTQTGYNPTLQGGIDFAHSSGFYLGNWNSNVESGLYRGASLEMDFYGGYKFAAGPVNLDVGALYYYYPSGGDKGGLGHVDQGEVYIGASFSYFTLKLSYGLTNFFGLGDGTSVDTDGNYYIDLGFAYDLGQGWGVNAHYGYQYVKNGKDAGLQDDNVSDYKVGVTKDLNGWLLGLSVVGTSDKDYFTTANLRDGGKTGVVVSVFKSF